MVSAFFVYYMKYLLASILLILFISCQDYTPKPIGYSRIEFPESKIIKYSFSDYSFDYPDYIIIDTLYSHIQSQYWFNIVYSQFNAVVHCTYLNITKDKLPQVLEDSYHLAYSHALKADGITQKLYANEEVNVSGIMYEIDGDVATPIQFFVTDSIRHFLRGSFYYTNKVDRDSVLPITDLVREDIRRMMNTFSWNEINKNEP